MTVDNKAVSSPPVNRHATAVLAATSLAYFLVILDTSAKNVALPGLGRDFGVSVTSLQLVVTSYLLVFSSLLLTGGLLCDRLSGKTVFTTGFALFGVGSLISAVAPSVPLLVAGQAIAGAGAALVTPASLAILVSTFPGPAERGKALGTWATIAGLGMAAGPLIGGVLTSAFGWRAVFVLNVPIVAVAVAIVQHAVQHVPASRSRHFDPWGQLLGILSLGFITFGIVNAGGTSWTDAWSLGCVLAGVVIAAVFVEVERRASEPMFPVKVYVAARPILAMLLGVALNFCTYGTMFLLAIYFQESRGYSPVQTGLAELPMLLLCVLLPRWAGKIIGRRGPWPPLLWGMAVLMVASSLLALVAIDAAYFICVPGLIAMGVGIALAVPAVSGAAVTDVPRGLEGSASATLSAARQTGGVLGVAALGSSAAGQVDSHVAVAFGAIAVVILIVLIPAAVSMRTSGRTRSAAA